MAKVKATIVISGGTDEEVARIIRATENEARRYGITVTAFS